LIEKRIRTDRDRFAAVLGSRPRAKILIEASTESEWVARCLEAHGHEVIVADPNYAPMYAHRSRRVKTDRRDARALAEACRIKAYRKAHRAADDRRHVRGRLAVREALVQTAVREALVQTRTKYISLVRALLRREGLRVRPGTSSSFVERVGELEIPKPLGREIAPILKLMAPLNRQIERATKDVEKIVHQDSTVRRLCTAPGFAATIDMPERFKGAHQVEAYLGLVPRELSSGEKQRKGRITKRGDRRTRCLLVEAAWALLRTRRPAVAPLRAWTERLAARRGRRVAVVALARKLAGILYAMMRDETEFNDKYWTAKTEGV
jgi:transposase